MTETLPPHSMEFEQSVIGALLADAKTAYPIVREILGPDLDAFYDLRHQSLYETINRMVLNDQPVNLLSVFEQLRLDGKAALVGGTAYLASLPDCCPSPAGVGYFAEGLTEYRQKRRLIALGTEAADRAHNGETSAELIDEVTRRLSGLQDKRASSVKPMKELVCSSLDALEKLRQSHGAATGLPTGFVDLDRMTNGLQEGDLIIIAARPSVGKTSLAMNIVEHVALDQGQPVAVFSMEMSDSSLVLRMLCCRARVNLRNVRDGFLAERDLPKLTSAAGKLAQSPLYIDDTPALTTAEFRLRAARMVSDYGAKLIVVDYLQLMRSSSCRKSDSRQNEVADISAAVKAVAKTHRIPVLALSQLNRDLERDHMRKPRLSDMRDSGALEQDADVVGFLWRPVVKNADQDEEEVQEAAAVNLSIAKQRNGPTGEVHLTFLKAYTRFESAAKIHP